MRLHYITKANILLYRNPYWPTWPLLEITQGCTHNRCKFCTMYKDVPFRMSPMEWIEEDLRELAQTDPDATTILLLSANPLVLPYDKLAPILEMIRRYLPKMEYGALTAPQLQEGMKQYEGEAYNDALAMDYLIHTKENVDWLKALYGKDDLVDSRDPGYVPLHQGDDDEAVEHTLSITIHPDGGESNGLVNHWVVDALYGNAVNAGVCFIFEATADDLLTDGNGTVCGIHATGRKGDSYTVQAGKVILACGGFGGNYEMLKAHSDMEKPFYLGPTSNRGWGIEAGESVGAKTAYATLPDIEGYNSMVYGTVGGLIVNQEARVLDANDTPIENLFAVGELTCVQALDLVHFSAGENISWNIYSGRIAGQVSAAELKDM